jgi:hypothetical protein
MKTPFKSLRSMSVRSLMLLAGLAISAHGQTTDSLESLSLTAPSAASGSSVEGRITLSKSTTEDIEVSLAADPVTAAKVPSSVTIKAGQTSATFTVTTLLSETAIGGDDAVVSIYANYGMTKHVELTVLAPVSFDRMIDKVITREHSFIENIKQYHPLAETYIQNMQEDKEHNVKPVADTYFLGRLGLKETTNDEVFQKDKPGKFHRFLSPFEMLEKNAFTRHYLPAGFAGMAILDRDLKKDNYYFTFVKQEFLGEVRCIVVDVQPREKAHQGSFVGRIWVEDHDFNIVRLNGTYSNKSNYDSYFHFDSWRMNMQPGVWLPSYIYSEETSRKHDLPPFIQPRFKAQTRFWDYDEVHIKHESEFTDVRVDVAQDRAEARAQATPLEAQRDWERLAEDNAVDHLQKVGLLAPPGPVDKVLQTVVNNLSITNNLDIIPDVRCRVLLTTPLESFTIGHTIVISRGLVDVLPDEAALAMVLSHELGHIVLNHRIDTKFAFNDRLFFSEQATFQRMDFGRSALDEQAADTKAIELLNNSPYKDKLASAGLFLRQLQDRAQVLPNLIRPHLGNPLGNKNTTRLATVATAAPKLENKIDQIAALSLGTRVNLNPWSNQIEMMSSKRVTLMSAGDKMPLEVTPFFPYLTRMSMQPSDLSQSAKVVGASK